MAERGYGTGQLYLKHGAYYGRWRTLDGRKLNRKIGTAGTGALTRAEAERQFRKLQEAEERRPIRAGAERHTLDEATDSLADGSPSRARASPTCRTASRCSASTSRHGSAPSPSIA